MIFEIQYNETYGISDRSTIKNKVHLHKNGNYVINSELKATAENMICFPFKLDTSAAQSKTVIECMQSKHALATLMYLHFWLHSFLQLEHFVPTALCCFASRTGKMPQIYEKLWKGLVLKTSTFQSVQPELITLLLNVNRDTVQI